MRRFLLAACVTALAAGITAAGSPAARPQPIPVTVMVCPTAAPNFADAAHVFVDGHGVQHVRKLPVYNAMHLGATCADPTVGTLDYLESFNLWPDGTSTAWCSFSMNSDYGAFLGHCNGSLATGHLVGHGAEGSTLEGTYELIDPATNAYRLRIEFFDR